MAEAPLDSECTMISGELKGSATSSPGASQRSAGPRLAKGCSRPR